MSGTFLFPSALEQEFDMIPGSPSAGGVVLDDVSVGLVHVLEVFQDVHVGSGPVVVRGPSPVWDEE